MALALSNQIDGDRVIEVAMIDTSTKPQQRINTIVLSNQATVLTQQQLRCS
jgi:hypothetical protein